jgi:hypothetical protein
VSKPRKSPEQLGRMLWEALRAEQPPGFRDCAIRVVRVKAGPSNWDAELIAKGGTIGGTLANVFAKAKRELQQRYGCLEE